MYEKLVDFDCVRASAVKVLNFDMILFNNSVHNGAFLFIYFSYQPLMSDKI